jgi:hypothetical protein
VQAVRGRLHQLEHDPVGILQIAGEPARVDAGGDRVGWRVEHHSGRRQLLVPGVDVVDGQSEMRGTGIADLR